MTVDPVLQRKDHIVFLLGAGFSKTFGAPLMCEFMHVARKNYFSLLDRGEPDYRIDHYEEMLKFHNECLRCSWAVNREWDNIEELYTQCDLLRLAGDPSKTVAEARCKHLAWAIWDVYRRPDTYPKNLGESLGTCHDGSEILKPVVLTTNYDLTCEQGIGDLNYYYPGFEAPWVVASKSQSHQLVREVAIGKEQGIEGTTRDGVIPVVKLHGSANWFSINADTCVASRVTAAGISSAVAPHSTEFLPERFIELVQTEVAPGISETTPAIIPPMLGKMSVYPAIAAQWSAAIEFLSRARFLIICGYSFPSTDAFMSRLIAEGLKNNPGIERILIVNRDAESEWEERRTRIFNPSVNRSHVRYKSHLAASLIQALQACRGNIRRLIDYNDIVISVGYQGVLW